MTRDDFIQTTNRLNDERKYAELADFISANFELMQEIEREARSNYLSHFPSNPTSRSNNK